MHRFVMRAHVTCFGMIARNNGGGVMATTSLFPLQVLFSLFAEASSLRWDMELARDLGFHSVYF